MKKILFSLLILSSSLFAQKIPGFHPYLGYAYENFGLPFEYPRIKWVDQGPKILITDSTRSTPDFSEISCVHKPDVFKYTIKREAVKKRGKVTLSQPYGKYEPFKVNFGKNLTGRQNVLDLSEGNAYLTFKIRNTSAYGLKMYAGLTDSLGKVVDAIGEHDVFSAYMDMILFYLAPGEEKTMTFDFNSHAYDIQFGPDPNYPCGDVYTTNQDFSFDYKAVSGAYFTIVNHHDAGAYDAYKSFKIEDATVEFSEVIIGAPTLGHFITTDLSEKIQEESIFLYPNPAKEVLHFSQPLQNVVLTNVIGNTVFEASEATMVDVQHLPKGVYMLRSTSLQHSMKVRVE